MGSVNPQIGVVVNDDDGSVAISVTLDEDESLVRPDTKNRKKSTRKENSYRQMHKSFYQQISLLLLTLLIAATTGAS